MPTRPPAAKIRAAALIQWRSRAHNKSASALKTRGFHEGCNHSFHVKWSTRKESHISVARPERAGTAHPPPTHTQIHTQIHTHTHTRTHTHTHVKRTHIILGTRNVPSVTRACVKINTFCNQNTLGRLCFTSRGCLYACADVMWRIPRGGGGGLQKPTKIHLLSTSSQFCPSATKPVLIFESTSPRPSRVRVSPPPTQTLSFADISQRNNTATSTRDLRTHTQTA